MSGWVGRLFGGPRASKHSKTDEYKIQALIDIHKHSINVASKEIEDTLQMWCGPGPVSKAATKKLTVTQKAKLVSLKKEIAASETIIVTSTALLLSLKTNGYNQEYIDTLHQAKISVAPKLASRYVRRAEKVTGDMENLHVLNHEVSSVLCDPSAAATFDAMDTPDVSLERDFDAFLDSMGMDADDDDETHRPPANSLLAPVPQHALPSVTTYTPAAQTHKRQGSVVVS